MPYVVGTVIKLSPFFHMEQTLIIDERKDGVSVLMVTFNAK